MADENAVFNAEGMTMSHTPSGSSVTAGDVIVIGEKVTVAKSDIADGEEGVVSVQGVFTFPKDNSTAHAQGIAVYWDDTADEITETDTSNELIGYTVEASLAADTETQCYLTNATKTAA